MLERAIAPNGEPISAPVTLSQGDPSLYRGGPTVALLANGDTVVGYYVHVGPLYDQSTPLLFHFRLLDNHGAPLGDEIAIPASLQVTTLPSVLAGGGFFVTAQGVGTGGPPSDYSGEIFNDDGSLRTAFAIAPGAPPNSAAAAGLANGDFVVAWRAASAASAVTAAPDFIRLYSPDGAPLTGAIQVDSHVGNGFLNLTALKDGGFALAYTADPDLKPSESQVLVEVFNEDGSVRHSPTVVNPGQLTDTLPHTVVALANGGFSVGWGGNTYQLFDAGGNPTGQIHTADLTFLEPVVGQNETFAAYPSSGFDPLSIQLGSFVRTSVGDGGEDSMVGDALRDSMSGGAGNDWLWGGAGDNTVVGGLGNDVVDAGGAGNSLLLGGEGNDYLFAREGADTVDGGPGSDVIWGGAGADRFLFDHLADSNNADPDLVVDFQHGTDKIDLRGMAPGLTWAGSTPTANAVWFTVSPTVTVIHIDAHSSYVGSDATINLYGTSLGLTASDFLL